MSGFLFDPERGGAADSALIGGKGANLVRVAAAGLAVPRWYAVTTEAFARGAAGPDGAVKVPPELEREIRDHHGASFGSAFVAVRSSAADEDAAGDSFAGIHDSFLYVRGADEVVAAVERVWASAFGERAISYRRSRNLPLSGFRMAVVVQEMVDAAVSGVVFTADPATQDPGRIVISALFGLGEGLVSQGLDADLFSVSKRDGSIETTLAGKEEAVVFDRARGRGTKLEPVDPARQNAAALTEPQIREIAAAAIALERRFRWPQDIEFALDSGGRLLILQSRPVTGIEEPGPAAGHGLLWDNSNIVESFSGPTSPLTFSVIRRAYAAVYRSFSEVMGIPREEIARSEPLFRNMLGLIHGRVYYNLLTWYRLLRLFPGYEYNRQFMESMMGVRESLALADDAAPPASFWRRWLVDLPRLGRLLAISSWRFYRIEPTIARFEADFERKFSGWAARDLRELDAPDLLRFYEEIESRTLTQWKPPIINDLFVMVFYGILKKLCARWCGDESGSLQNDLLAGEGGIRSTEPTRMLMSLAREARKDPELCALFAEAAPETLREEILVRGRFPEWGAGFRRYLDLYGFRCVNELKLEEPTLRDRPEFAFRILKNYLAGDPAALDTDAADRREQQVRSEAEARALASIGSPVRRLVFRRVVANARMGVKNRENMRFARTRVFGQVREVMRAIGRRFEAEGILEESADVFYLTLAEIEDFIRGTAVTTRLRELVALRKREFDAWKEPDAETDDRFETYGSVYHRNRFRGAAAVPQGEDGLLRGIACSPGVVSGAVKVILTPAEDAKLAGEILVAGRTDPGWVPLYPSISGLLIERGSILSHSAIVAREMGIPTIVGIPRLTSTLRTGDAVTMDGSAGTVRIETPAASADEPLAAGHAGTAPSS